MEKRNFTKPTVKLAFAKSTEKLAFDSLPVKFSWKDEDGHLFIDKSPITKEQIRPYIGHEVSNCEEMGWDTEKIYKLYCPADELKKSEKTFNKCPLHLGHVHVTAEDPHLESLVGCVGESESFEEPYLFNSLGIWRQDAIDGIKNGTSKEISCAYRYEVDPTPGVFEGEAYDGIMRNIRGNHVALVEKGRAGPDVCAWDHLPKSLQGKSMTKTKFSSSQRKAAAGLVHKLLKGGKIAMDSDPEEIENKLKEAADACSDIDTAEDEDPTKKDPEAQDEDNSEEEVNANDEAVTPLETPDPVPATSAKTAMDSDEIQKLINKEVAMREAKSKMAMDARLEELLTKQRNDLKNAEQARREVMPVIGNIMANDSAYDDALAIYGAGLNQLGVDTAGVHKDLATYRTLFRTANNKKSFSQNQTLAQDSAGSSDFYKEMGINPMKTVGVF